MRYHLMSVGMAIIKSLQTINPGEGMEKREPSYTLDENVNWYKHYGEQYGGSLKKSNKKLPYDPGIPLLCIYSERTIIPKNIHAPPNVYYSSIYNTKTWTTLVSIK